MQKDYFKKTKSRLKKVIPSKEANPVEFEKFKKGIVASLKRKKNKFLIRIRRFSTLILGDWSTQEQKELLSNVKNSLLTAGYYAETIDAYCDVNCKGGLTPKQILEECCIKHQLIILIDGKNTGTLVEQEYLAPRYALHKKLLFFIGKNKFEELSEDPAIYFNNFPTIIPYVSKLDKLVTTFVSLRLYRLAQIIELQEKQGRGLSSKKYVSLKKRLYGKRYHLRNKGLTIGETINLNKRGN